MIPASPRHRPPSVFHLVLLALMVFSAFVIGVVRTVRGDDPPKAVDVPAAAWEDVRKEEVQEEVLVEEPLQENAADETVEIAETVEALPSSHNLALPFTSQAPFGTWDAVHEETCEEASMLMVAEYFSGTPQGTIAAATADAAMLDIVAFEEAMGYGVSVSVDELQDIILGHYKGLYSVTIVEEPSADDIKALVADGYPVIVPAAGRMLGNPFFTGEGPLYHMLVIRGYTETSFITNDPGTRHGDNYLYSFEVLMDAIHDWNDGDPTTGAKRVIVMKPVGS